MTIPHAAATESDGADAATADRHALLHAAIAPLADELRLVDCADLVSTVLRGQLANLDDLIQSSLEPFFVPHAFSFGWAADAALGWTNCPEVSLEMEFAGPGITLFFALRLLGTRHETLVRFIGFDGPGDPAANTRRLAAALRAARPGARSPVGSQAPDKSFEAE